MCTKEKRQPITKKERAIVYGRARGLCQMCGKELLFGQMTVDHIVPLDKGGKNTLGNYQCLCQQCNFLKANFKENDFYEKITEIFWFQTQRRCGKEFTKKMVMAAMG
mgnify:FL=1